MEISLRSFACKRKHLLTSMNKPAHVEHDRCLMCLVCMPMLLYIRYRNLKLEDFTHHNLSKTKWELTYANSIQVVLSKEY